MMPPITIFVIYMNLPSWGGPFNFIGAFSTLEGCATARKVVTSQMYERNMKGYVLRPVSGGALSEAGYWKEHPSDEPKCTAMQLSGTLTP